MNKRTSLLVALFAEILLIGSVELLWAKDEAPEKKSEPLATFQIAKNGDAIVLPVTVGKKEYLFWLDTGATFNVIDKSLKNELGNYQSTENILTSKESIAIESFESPPLQLANLLLETNGKVLCCDLVDIRRLVGREIFGIIGMDSLKHFVVLIDFDKGEAKFYPQEAKAETHWGESFDINYDHRGCPHVNISFDGAPFSFLIDTGATGMMIDKSLFLWLYPKRRLGIIGNSPNITLAGRMESSTYMMNRFTLGSFEHGKLICDQGNLNLLGLPYLSRYQVTFDFPHEKVYFKKGKRYQEIEHDNMSGLHILQEDKKAVVKIVDADSPAEIAGIQPEDKILRVDDQDVSKISMFELRNLFTAGDGKKIRLTISRDGKEMEKLLILKEKIPQWAESAKE